MRHLIRRGRHFCKRHFSVLTSWISFNLNIKKGFGRDNVYVLLSHNANGEGGASVVLFDYAHYLRKQGKVVIILTGKGGTLVNLAKADGIFCFEMGRLYKRYIEKIQEIPTKGFIVCTITCLKYIKCFTKLQNKRVIWWIHEEERLLKKYASNIPTSLNSNVKIMCGSDRIQESLKIMRPDLQTGIMYYGCRDQEKKYRDSIEKKEINKSDKFVITAIGRIDERKNQLQIISAIKMLPIEIQRKVQLNLITGSWEQTYRNKVEDSLKSTKSNFEFSIYGPIPSDELYLSYVKTDLLVCSSVDDPLPVVVTNAMMYGIEYVVSSGTGQSKIITNGIDGWIYNLNNTGELSRIIQRYVDGSSPKIGVNARKLFLRNFSFSGLDSSVNKNFESKV